MHLFFLFFFGEVGEWNLGGAFMIKSMNDTVQNFNVKLMGNNLTPPLKRFCIWILSIFTIVNYIYIYIIFFKAQKGNFAASFESLYFKWLTNTRNALTKSCLSPIIVLNNYTTCNFLILFLYKWPRIVCGSVSNFPCLSGRGKVTPIKRCI